MRAIGRGALAALLFLLAPAALQAAAFRLVLADGSEIVGTIRGFEDGMYAVETSAGQRQLRSETVKTLEPMTTTAAIDTRLRPDQQSAFAPVPEFTFATKDSRLVVGRLAAFEEGFYEIRTRSGTVVLPVDQVSRMEVTWIERPPTPAPSGKPLAAGAIRLAGSDAMATLHIPALIEAYSADGGGRDPLWSRGAQPQTRTFSADAAGKGKFRATVRSAELNQAVDALARGEADLVLMSRKMRPDEAKRILDRGLGNVLSPAQEHELAPGGVAVVVHPSNAVKTLQLQQVADIIAGRIRNWGEVGGTPRRIQVFVPEEGAGVLDFFREKILPGADLMATAKRVESNAEMADIVGSDPAAIGFVEYSYVGNTMPLSFTDSCGRQIGPNEFTLQTRDYPLSTPLYLYTSNRITPAARAFLNFALSKPGQVALKQGGLTSFLPVAQPRRTFDAVAADWPVPSRPVAAELKRFMTSSTRMSVTLGFSEGLQLSRDSERELGRLTSFLQTEADGTRLVLLGFSDRSANFGSDVRLSERRAQLVEQKLKQKGVKTERVFGLGPLLPVSCDKSPEGSARNRRVEAWVY